MLFLSSQVFVEQFSSLILMLTTSYSSATSLLSFCIIFIIIIGSGTVKSYKNLSIPIKNISEYIPARYSSAILYKMIFVLDDCLNNTKPSCQDIKAFVNYKIGFTEFDTLYYKLIIFIITVIILNCLVFKVVVSKKSLNDKY